MLGYPASGKSSWTAANLPSHRRVNRDTEGGSVDALLPKVEAALDEGHPVALDNTYAKAEHRRPVLDLARKRGVPVRCVWLDTSIEDAQVNAVARMVQRHGSLLSEDALKKVSKKDPNTFPPAVLFHYRKSFEEPTEAEGFSKVERVRFQRSAWPAEHSNRALLLDYDGTLRKTLSGEKYPTKPDDIALLPGRAAVLERYVREGWKLLGVSNQSGVSKGALSHDDARACFARTNQLLGLDIEVSYCPHNPAPIACWCRKPMPGMAVDFIVRHKLDPKASLVVGDMTSDKTFAARAGIPFVDAERFFAT